MGGVGRKGFDMRRLWTRFCQWNYDGAMDRGVGVAENEWFYELDDSAGMIARH